MGIQGSSGIVCEESWAYIFKVTAFCIAAAKGAVSSKYDCFLVVFASMIAAMIAKLLVAKERWTKGKTASSVQTYAKLLAFQCFGVKRL